MMNSTICGTSLGLFLSATAFTLDAVEAQTAPSLAIHTEAGAARITITGAVNTVHAIQATTNLAVSSSWVVLTNVVLPTGPWVYIDYASPGMAKRFYRTTGLVTNVPPETNSQPVMVRIAPGTFTMGSPTTEPSRESDEVQHTVTISREFWMGKYELTQGEYQAVMGSNPSHFTGDLKLPVERVSWNDATNYCGKLTVSERAAGRLPVGYVYRLPTEAEWEYACRAGSTTATAYGNSLSSVQANFYGKHPYNYNGADQGTNVGKTTVVGSYATNAWGLYDMHGNVDEWCLDWYGSYPSGSVTDPQGASSDSYRVLRGGGWANDGWVCRSANRRNGPPTLQGYGLGFRPVLAPGQ